MQAIFDSLLKRRRRANLLIGKEDKLVDSIVIDRKK